MIITLLCTIDVYWDEPSRRPETTYSIYTSYLIDAVAADVEETKNVKSSNADRYFRCD